MPKSAAAKKPEPLIRVLSPRRFNQGQEVEIGVWFPQSLSSEVMCAELGGLNKQYGYNLEIFPGNDEGKDGNKGSIRLFVKVSPINADSLHAFVRDLARRIQRITKVTTGITEVDTTLKVRQLLR